MDHIIPMPEIDPKLLKMRILIVDGHFLVREGLLSLFWLSGDMNAMAINPEQAMRIAPHFMPELVLLDAALPAGKSMQIAESLTAECPAAKIIFLDDEMCHDRVRSAARLKVAGYWTKHVSFDQLLEIMTVVANGGTAFCPGASEYMNVDDSRSSEYQ
jgi:DNA-binding NarL/FixJ family response regulator